MPAKAIPRQSVFGRCLQSLVIGVAGSATMAAAAQAACPATATGGLVTINDATCNFLNLSSFGAGTSLYVTVAGNMTISGSTTVISGNNPVGNITVDGVVRSLTANAIASNPGVSVGNLSIGATGVVSGAGVAIDFRNTSTSLGSFTNYGSVSGANAYATSVATISGDIRNFGSLTSGSGGIVAQNQTINGSILNNQNITTTGTGNNNSGIRFVSNVVLNGDLRNAGTINGSAGSGSNVTSGILTGGVSSISRSLTNSGAISGFNIGVNLTNTSIAGALTNSGAGAITAVNSGIRISGGALGSLLNSGSITTSGAGSAGILSSGVTYNGAVTNSGAIRSLATGLSLSGGRINGDVSNTARPSGALAITSPLPACWSRRLTTASASRLTSERRSDC